MFKKCDALSFFLAAQLKLLCIFYFVRGLISVCTTFLLELGYSIFYPYRGVEGKFSGGAPEAFSKGVKD